MSTQSHRPTDPDSINTSAAFSGTATLADHLGDAADLDAELARFEAEQRAELGLPPKEVEQWIDPPTAAFTASQREHTTILVSGLTMAQDLFVQAALEGLGYKMHTLDCPDNEALRYGKEYGNRGQCNPTYFTVGNLVKHLSQLRDSGKSTKEIVDNYVFLTAGACGPCRFGTYVTEYRKALRDAGFDGFRVILFQQTGGLDQATGEEAGLEMKPPFFIGLLKALVVGDVLNALGYRIRPYEVVEGATDEALTACKEDICDTLRNKKLIVPALIRCRRRLAAVEVDRTRVKPRVAIIGEFWAMTTEGDGNYKLQRFLESEGAEVDIQLVTAWILYMLWEGRWDTKRRYDLRKDDGGRYGLDGSKPWQTLAGLEAADRVLRGIFQSIAHTMGLTGYHLPDMDELAEIAHPYYDNASRGGEGHMEVGKLIQNVVHQKVNMTLSVKPFGCMPSSGVSDGVQSLVTQLHPDAIFLPIETSGDGEVNVQSRIQMMLFKARQAAKKQVDEAMQETGMTPEAFAEALRCDKQLANPLYKPGHKGPNTTYDLVHAAADRQQPRRTRLKKRARAIATGAMSRVAG